MNLLRSLTAAWSPLVPFDRVGKHKTLYLTNYFKLVNLRKLHPQKNGLFESRHKKDPQPRFVKNREATIQEEELS